MTQYATEPTLQELLEESKKMAKSLEKISSILDSQPLTSQNAGGPSGSKWTSIFKVFENLGPMGKAFAALTTAVGALSFSIGFVIGAFSGLVSKTTEMLEGFDSFTQTLTDGNLTATRFFEEMKKLVSQLPILGGLFGLLMTPMVMAVRRQEESLEMFRKLSTVGVGLGQDLDKLRTSARHTGLSMDQYADIIANNGEALARMGGNTETGTALFTKSMTKIYNSSNDVGRAFMGMGYTANDTAQALMNYMATHGTLSRATLSDTKSFGKAVLEAAQQTMYLAESTGKRRDQIEQEMKEATMEENWQAFLAGLSDDQKKAMNESVKYAMAHGGKDMANTVKTGIMTGVVLPWGQQMKNLDALSGGAGSRFAQNMVDIAKSGKDYNARIKDMDRANAGFTQSTRQAVEMTQEVNALNMAQGKQALIDSAVLANSNRAMENGRIKSTAQQLREGEEMRKKIAEAGKGNAAEVAQLTQNIRNFGNRIDDWLGKVLSPFFNAAEKVSGSFMKLGDHLMNVVQPLAEQFGAWLSKWIGNFADVKSWEEFKQTFNDFFKDVWENVKPILASFWEVIKPTLKAGFDKLIDYILDALREKLGPLGWFLGESSSEQRKEAKRKQEEEDRRRNNEAGAKRVELHLMDKNISELEEKKKKAPTTPGLFTKSKDEVQAEIDRAKAERAAFVKKNAAALNQQTPAQLDKRSKEWAFTILTNQHRKDQVPAELKSRVETQLRDQSVQKQAQMYLDQQRKKKAEAEAKANRERQEKELAKRREYEEKRKDMESEVYSAAVAPQTPAVDPLEAISKHLENISRYTKETAVATNNTAKQASRHGNLFRS